jgi:hypothetical protein
VVWFVIGVLLQYAQRKFNGAGIIRLRSRRKKHDMLARNGIIVRKSRLIGGASVFET